MKTLYILKNPNPTTLLARTYADECPIGFVPSTEEDAAAWEAAQIAEGWQPAPVNLPAAPAVPALLPAWRVKAVAALHGLTGPIATVLASLPEPQRTVATLAWNEGNEIDRHSPTLAALANALALDAATIDALFVEAAALDV